MHLQNITKLLNLQDINIVNISDIIDGTVYITVEPVEYVQECTCGHSKSTIRRGKSGYRKVRHLSIFENKTVLLLPRIRMYCKECFISFTWQYPFASGKSRYTNSYKAYIADAVTGSTVTQASRVTKTPYSTTERIFKEYLDTKTPELQDTVLSLSKQTNRLVIGIDDFSTRKGHTYNTAIHDLRNETLLHIIPSRNLEDLLKDTKKFPEIYEINPIAVVMDLAPQYHALVREIFPNALRIADRFHVNGYALEAVQNTRKRVSGNMASRNRALLKRNKFLLNKRHDQLTDNEKTVLRQILKLSSALDDVYAWKEELIEWYDCCTSYKQAEIVYDRWLNKGRSLELPEVNVALITFEHSRQEILNYHACRFTNGPVEGRNNKIKALMRRHYFTPNKNYYDFRIKLECNAHILTA